MPREVAFSEQLIQPFLTAKEAYALALTSISHNNQVQLYRLERANEFHEKFCLAHDTKETCAKNHTLTLDNGMTIDSRSVVFDISGNSASGVSLDCEYVVVFGVHPEYCYKSKAKPSTLSYGGPIAFRTTDNRILGACLFSAWIPQGPCRFLRPYVVIYLPSGHYGACSILDNDCKECHLSVEADFSTITISKAIACSRASVIAANKIDCSVVSTNVPIFVASIAGLKQSLDTVSYKAALEELQNYSTS